MLANNEKLIQDYIVSHLHREIYMKLPIAYNTTTDLSPRAQSK